MDYKVQARMHGIDIPDKGGKKPVSKPTDDFPSRPGEVVETLPFAFKDPKEYAHLTQEQREELTQKMMGTHKLFLQDRGVLTQKKPKTSG